MALKDRFKNIVSRIDLKADNLVNKVNEKISGINSPEVKVGANDSIFMLVAILLIGLLFLKKSK